MRQTHLRLIEPPTSAATEAGVGNHSRRGALRENYATGSYPATEFDIEADAPQPVMAYVSRSIVYVLDESLNVVAYGRLIRRGVPA